jgi:hypothetical protein
MHCVIFLIFAIAWSYMRFLAFLFLLSPAAFAQKIPLSFQGVEMVYARIYSSYETRSSCDDIYLSGAIVEAPRVRQSDVGRMAMEPGGRTVYLTSGIRALSKYCPELPEKRTITISTRTFILYAVNGDLNVTLDIPEGYWVETQAFPLPSGN